MIPLLLAQITDTNPEKKINRFLNQLPWKEIINSIDDEKIHPFV